MSGFTGTLGAGCTVLAAAVALAGLVVWRVGKGQAAFTGGLVFLWWVPAVSASVGILLGDALSAVIGLALWAGGGVAVCGYRVLESLTLKRSR